MRKNLKNRWEKKHPLGKLCSFIVSKVMDVANIQKTESIRYPGAVGGTSAPCDFCAVGELPTASSFSGAQVYCGY